VYLNQEQKMAAYRFDKTNSMEVLKGAMGELLTAKDPVAGIAGRLRSFGGVIQKRPIKGKEDLGCLAMMNL
jgi:hypothetical protein